MNFLQLYRHYDRSFALMLGAICALAFALLAFGWQKQKMPAQLQTMDTDDMRVVDFEYQLVHLPKTATEKQAQTVSNASPTFRFTTAAAIDWPESKATGKTDLPVLPDEIIDTTDIFVPGAEVFPVFPGGDAALLRYLSGKLRYTSAAIEHRIQGRVYLSFVVEIDGSISNVTVLRGLGFGLDQEAIRAVQGMPRWQPGYQNGRPVAVVYHLPVQFSLR